jgi:type I restriction enzyme, S subunit
VQQAIAQQEQLIRTTAELKKALMHKLFTEGLYGEKQKETAIGLIPESWDVVPLKSLLTEPLRNGHSAKETISTKGIPTLTLTAITKNNFSVENTKVTCADSNKVKDLWLQCGDIFVERANTLDYVGLAALYEGESDFAIFPDLLIRVRVDKNRLLPKTLVEYLLTNYCRVYFRKHVNSTTGNFPKISQPTIENLLVPIPSRSEQIEIEAIFRALDKKLDISKQKKVIYTDLFRTLLHQLMTAQIRVHDIDLPGFDDLVNITPQGSFQGSG